MGGGRNLIGRRTQSDWTADGNRWQRGHFQGALLGGALVSSAPTKLHQQSKQRECPTEYAEHTEHSGRESLPQIDTDAHRLGGYGIPAIPTPPITQPNHLWKSVKSVGEYHHAGAAASARLCRLPEQELHQQSKWGECPTEHAEHTEHSGRESLPQIGTDAHRLGGYGIPAIPTLPITQPNHLWKSVNSVGEYYHAHKQADGERVSHRTRGTHRTFWQRSASHR